MDYEKLVNDCQNKLSNIYKDIDKIEFNNTKKVLKAFHDVNICESDFASSTGYGYNDVGREKIEKVFAKVLGTQDALVRNQFISGSHALNVTFFALLRPGDTLLTITGKPYDTLNEVIGIKNNPSSLMSFGINYKEIELVNNDFDYLKIKEAILKQSIKVIHIQRSRGYSLRDSISIDKVKKVIKFIKDIDSNIIIMIDNCYCEFVLDMEVGEVGADIIVGSLIKNLGGGIAPNGAYVAGCSDLINLVAERLTLPGEGREVGPTLGINKSILQGLFMAPSVVASSLKIAVLTAYVFEKLGYEVSPKYNEVRADIVQTITFKSKDKLIKYVQGIQSSSPIDSNSLPVPSDMPGYHYPVIMASGSFVQGSSIEISADAPIVKPYVCYQQGGLSYQSGKIALIKALKSLDK